MGGYQSSKSFVTTSILSGFGGEIEESYLLVCHFYLPKERADTYRYKILSARCPLADVLSSACGTPPSCHLDV
jgi:hypothetical protein